MGGILELQKVAVLTSPMDADVKLPSHYLLVMQAAGQAGGGGDSGSISRWREGELNLYC